MTINRISTIYLQGPTSVIKDSSQLDDIISAVLDEGTNHTVPTADSVKIPGIPLDIRQFDQIMVEYRCIVPSRVGLELIVSTSVQSDLRIVLETWNCSAQSEPATRSIIVRLPNSLAYRPSHFNKRTMFVESASLQGWVLHQSTWNRTKCNRSCYKKAVATVRHPVGFLLPYDRPGIPMKQCLSWWLMLKLVTLKDRHRLWCSLEPGNNLIHSFVHSSIHPFNVYLPYLIEAHDINKEMHQQFIIHWPSCPALHRKKSKLHNPIKFW